MSGLPLRVRPGDLHAFLPQSDGEDDDEDFNLASPHQAALRAAEESDVSSYGYTVLFDVPYEYVGGTDICVDASGEYVALGARR